MKNNFPAKLSHFYIVSGQVPLANSEALESELIELIKNYLTDKRHIQKFPEDPRDFLDLFIMNPLKTQYTVEQAKDLVHFFEMRSSLGGPKFAILNDAHTLSTTVMNKLLKLLEEPPSDGHIFLLNPKKVSLLPTVQSRSQSLKLTIKDPNENSVWDQKIQEWKKIPPTFLQFQEEFADPKSFEEFLISLSEFCKDTNDSEYYSSLQNLLREYEQSRTFHQSAAGNQREAFSFLQKWYFD